MVRGNEHPGLPLFRRKKRTSGGKPGWKEEPRRHAMSARGIFSRKKTHPDWLKDIRVHRITMSKVEPTEYGWQVYVWSESMERFIPEGQPWPTEEEAEADAEQFDEEFYAARGTIGILAENSNEELEDMLFSGMVAIMEHGEMGELTPQAAFRFEVQDELLRRGVSKEEIQKIMYTRYKIYKATQEED